MSRVLLIAEAGRVRDALARALEQAGFEVEVSTAGPGGETTSDDAAGHVATVVLADDDADARAEPFETVRQEPLTGREREVLGLLADGLSNRAIASRLGISEHTVKVHVSTIYAKLGAANRAEAVTRGIQRGLVAI